MITETNENDLLLKINGISYRYNQTHLQRFTNLFQFMEKRSSSSKKLVLDNCSLNVPKGKIYSLLGSSGCGKTTILKCILGIVRPMTGNIKVFLDNNKSAKCLSEISGSNVGYMPQEMALMEEITIEETLKYFGQLHQMSMKLIDERIEFLLKFLQITDKTRFVGNLSGGQQRRVSLAAAMLHFPLLLILDEPTVGVDPILRHAIWQYLETLCERNKITVIITTHYIEEARNSHNIGMMRGGNLLVEGNPDAIMKRHNVENMEDVFLIICLNKPKIVVERSDDESQQQQEITQNNKSTNGIIATYNKTNNSSVNNNDDVNININTANADKFRKKRFTDNFSHMQALLYKNWFIIRGNPKSLLFLYLLPSISLSLFALSLGAEPYNIPMAVHSPESPPDLTAVLLGYINDTKAVNQVNYDSIQLGIESVRAGKTWALMSLPENYSESLDLRVEESLDASDTTIEFSNIALYLDTSNPIITITIFKSILASLIRLLQTHFPDISHLALRSIAPIDLREVIYGSDSLGNIDTDMTRFMAPGVLMACIFIAPWPFVMFAITKEKKIKFLARSIISGANSYEILLSNLVVQLVILATQVITLVFTTFYLWQIQIHGSILLASALIFLQGVIGILFAVIITSVCYSEGEAFILSFSIILPIWTCCGILWPTEGMPELGYKLIHFAPLTYPIDGLRCIMSRGWFIDNYAVMFTFSFSFVYIILFFIIAVFIYKYFITAD